MSLVVSDVTMLQPPPTCGLGLATQGDGAHDGWVEDEMGGVLSNTAQQAADALADVRLRVVQPREQLGDDA